MEFETLKARLYAKIIRDSGDTEKLLRLEAMAEGHAGLTYGFTVADSSGAERNYILKLAPVGVARRGNTDVYRQAPLLNALWSQGLPVPQVSSASNDNDELGTAYLVMERLPGRPFIVWEPDQSFELNSSAVIPLWHQAATALAGIHAFEWREYLPNWQVARHPAEELSHWN